MRFTVVPCVAAIAALFPPHIDAQVRQANRDATTRSERVAGWMGATVTLLGDLPLRCGPDTSKTSGGPYVEEGKPQERLPASRFQGKKASIASAEYASYSLKVVLQVEGAPVRIITVNDNVLGFQSELEAARRWIGQPLWARGAQTLRRPGDICGPRFSSSEDRVRVKNLQRLTVQDVEFGGGGQRLIMRVKTDDGSEGFVDGYQGYLHFDPAYESNPDTTRSYAAWFHLQNPRSKRPTWKATTWKLIEDGDVAIGMTRDMATLACGREMRVVGFVMTTGTQEVATMYECVGKRFLIDKDVVTKYVER